MNNHQSSHHHGGIPGGGNGDESSYGAGSALMTASADPVSVAKSLIELQEELKKVTSDKSALETTRLLSATFLDDVSFLLLFLRAVNFSAKSAADRILRHLQTKMTLFGPDKLVNNITIQDLSLNDQIALSSGGLQFLASKDRHGRAVLITRYSRMKYQEPSNIARAIWFLLMTALDSDVVQKDGIVWVVFEANPWQTQGANSNLLNELTNSVCSIPVQVKAVHYCSSAEIALPDNFANSIALTNYVQVQRHIGTPEDCISQLASVGIDGHQLRTFLLDESDRSNKKRGADVLEEPSPALEAPSSGSATASVASSSSGPATQISSLPPHLATLLSAALQQQTSVGSGASGLPPNFLQELSTSLQQYQQVVAPAPGSTPVPGTSNQDQMLQQLQAAFMGNNNSTAHTTRPSTLDVNNVLQPLLLQGLLGQQLQQQQLVGLEGGHQQAGTGSSAPMPSSATNPPITSTPASAAAVNGNPNSNTALNNMLLPQLLANMQNMAAVHPSSYLLNPQLSMLLPSMSSQAGGGNLGAATSALFGTSDHSQQQQQTSSSNHQLSGLLGGSQHATHQSFLGPKVNPDPLPPTSSPRIPGMDKPPSPPININGLFQLHNPSPPQESINERGGPAGAARPPPYASQQQSKTHRGMQPVLLYSEADEAALSAYQCLVRQQIEMFEATDDDVQFNVSKMSKMIALGQVGIRCRHCSALPQYSRPKAAVYYPRSLDSLYQFGQNMVKNHLCGTCTLIPPDTKQKLMALQEERRRGKGGRERWAEAARELGVYEVGDGLRFK